MNDEDVARDPWRGVYHALRAAIVSGEYPPGSRLVEQQLADRFRTSRGPVRTALHELERSGLVVSDRPAGHVRALHLRRGHRGDLQPLEGPVRVRGASSGRAEDARGPGRGWRTSTARVAGHRRPGRVPGIRHRAHAQGVRHGEPQPRHGDLRVTPDPGAGPLDLLHVRVGFTDASEYWFTEAGSLADLCDALLRGDADAAVATSNAGLDQFEASIRERRRADSSAAD